MANKIKTNRITQAVLGCVALLLIGVVYAWSVLSIPIAEEFTQWNKAQLSLTFTIVMILFCIGGFIGGLLSSKYSPRVYLWVSSVLFLIGFIIASRMQALLSLYLGFGVVCGFASGLAYNAVMSSVGKWFPDKQGLISGILLMGFGLSSFLIGKLYQAWTPTEIGGWRTSFMVMGILIAAVLFLCGIFISKPSKISIVAKDFSKKKHYVNPVAMELSTKEMLQKPGFWLYFLWAIFLSAAGLALLSQASSIAKEVGPSISVSTIATVVGMISIFNGVGRFSFGILYDHKGRSITMQLVNLLFILTSITLALALKFNSFFLLIIGFIFGGLSYGGVPPTNSAFTSSYYGLKHYPLNFSIINANLLLASFGSTIAGMLYDASQSYMSTYIMILSLAIIGILISCGIGICDKKILQSKK